jgi:transcriptional regulator with XRE-family HTH domain
VQGEMGEALRTIRHQRGFSLRSVAAAIGVSPSLLSQVENGKTQPSVSTLYAMVNHLGVTIDEIMPGTSPSKDRPEQVAALPVVASAPLSTETGDAIQRRTENPRIEMGNGVVWERLAIGQRQGFVDPLMVSYEPGGGSATDGRLMRHSGIEYGVIIEGQLTLQLDFETYLLGPGDSVCFESQRPHVYSNRTDKPVRAIWFVLGRRESSAMEADLGQRVAAAGTTPQMRTVVDVLEGLDGVSDAQKDPHG